MELSTSRQQTKKSTSHTPANQADLNNLTIPTELLTSLRDNVLAIGLFCLIARLFIIHQMAVPLSAVDITLYDPTVSRGTIWRAMQRLIDGGFVVQARVGNKTTYRPCWGRIRGVVRLWDFDQPQLNRPRHLHTTPFDKRMLDLYLGRLNPHPHLPSQVIRYSSAPILSLRDVGAYLLSKVGYSQGTSALQKCGLVQDGLVRQVPDEATVLAWISQQTMDNSVAPSLTEKGFKRLGIEVAEPKQPAESGGQLMVYIPPENPRLLGGLLGGFLGRLLGLEALKTASKTALLPALEADKSLSPSETEKITWSHMDLMHDSTTQVVAKKADQKSLKNQSELEKLPNTPTAQALRKIGVRPSVVRELCNEPLDYVNEIIEQARSCSDVRSIAAWTVAALRDSRDHGWRPQSKDIEAFDLEKYTTGKYAEAFGEAPAPAVEEEIVPIKDRAEPEVVMSWIKATLTRKFNREASQIVRRMELLDAGELPVVGCASVDDLTAVAGKAVVGRLDASINDVFREFGWVNPPQFVLLDAAEAGSTMP